MPKGTPHVFSSVLALQHNSPGIMGRSDFVLALFGKNMSYLGGGFSPASSSVSKSDFWCRLSKPKSTEYMSEKEIYIYI